MGTCDCTLIQRPKEDIQFPAFSLSCLFPWDRVSPWSLGHAGSQQSWMWKGKREDVFYRSRCNLRFCSVCQVDPEKMLSMMLLCQQPWSCLSGCGFAVFLMHRVTSPSSPCYADAQQGKLHHVEQGSKSWAWTRDKGHLSEKLRLKSQGTGVHCHLTLAKIHRDTGTLGWVKHKGLQMSCHRQHIKSTLSYSNSISQANVWNSMTLFSYVQNYA